MLRAASTATFVRTSRKRSLAKRNVLRSLLAVCLAAGLSTLTLQASAQDYRSDPIGGPGGGNFSLRCAAGDYLVGFRVRAGDWVDAIAPLCANWDVGRQAFLPPGVGPMQGGAGGSIDEIACNQTSALTAMLIEIVPTGHRNVAMLLPYCTSVVNLEDTNPGVLNYFGTTLADRSAREDGLGTSFYVRHDLSGRLQCHDGDFAVGIYGASGAYVDRIGLICAPRPVVRAPIIVMAPMAPITPQQPPVSAGANPPVPSVILQGPSRADTGSNLPVAPQRPSHCRQGYVWREARIPDFVCVTPQARDLARAENAAAPSRIDPNGAYGPASCVSGYVWREAFDGDLVCVTPARRDQVREENRLSPNFEAR